MEEKKVGFTKKKIWESESYMNIYKGDGKGKFYEALSLSLLVCFSFSHGKQCAPESRHSDFPKGFANGTSGSICLSLCFILFFCLAEVTCFRVCPPSSGTW